jgi:outer membrane lipoprotein-sorting protein
MMSSVRPLCAAAAAGITSLLLATGQVVAADAPAAPAAKTAPAGKAVAAKKAADPHTPAPAPQVQVPNLTAAEVLEKHIAARGGAQAWKAVQGLQLSGKIDAGTGDNNARAMKMVEASKKANGRGSNAEIAAANGPTDTESQVQLPFTLDLKRPNKMRLEVLVAGKTAVQVYDGQQGWKLRPFLNRTDTEPFTKDEAKTEASRDDLDGPLIGSVAKGAKVSLDGAELVDGQPAYKLKVTQKNGDVKHVWIDAKTFLDVKIDGFPRHMDGKMHNVYVYQRDFRKVDGGVLIPFVQETTVDGYSDKHKLVIEKAAVNPHLENALFTKPHA